MKIYWNTKTFAVYTRLVIANLQLELRPSFSHSDVVCVNFIHEWRDLQFKGESARQIYF